MSLHTLRETVQAMAQEIRTTDDLEKCLEQWVISIHAHAASNEALAAHRDRAEVQKELARLMEVEHGFLFWKPCHDQHDPPAMVRKEFAPTVTRLLTQPARAKTWMKSKGLA